MIYKVESFHLFETMLNNLNVKAMSALMRGQIYMVQRPPQEQQQPQQRQDTADEAPRAEAPKAQPQVKRAMPERGTDYSRYNATKEQYPGEDAQRRPHRPSRDSAPLPPP